MSPPFEETEMNAIPQTIALRALANSTLSPSIRGEIIRRIRVGDLQAADLGRAVEQYDWFAEIIAAEYRRQRGR